MLDHPEFDPAPRRRFTLSGEERAKIDAFIRDKGVTLCPAAGSREMAQLHIERERQWAALQRDDRLFLPPSAKRKRGRPSGLTAEEKKARMLECARKYREANREKIAAKRVARRERLAGFQAKKIGGESLSPLPQFV